MILTLKPSQQPGYADPYAYPSAPRSPSSFYSTPPKSASSLPPLSDSGPRRMSGPHRGLPPPSVMERTVMERNLPLPDRAQQQNPHQLAALPALPAAPTQWQGHDESMRSWLQAKSEEDRRKQEEEKSRQEGLKLEQRKIEHNMLQESLQGGIPPPMVPMIFASIGGANVSNISMEWAQHYMAQISLQQQQAQVLQQQQVQQQQQQQQQQVQQQVQQQQQQQQQVQQQIQQAPAQIQTSPEQRRDQRLVTGPTPNPYGAQQMQPPAQSAPAQPVQQPQPNAAFTPAYQNSTIPAERVRPQQQIQAAPSTSNPRPTTSSASLARLNTGDLHAPPPGTSAIQIGAQHTQIHQTQTSQQPEQPSSPLYFHHWQPPDSQSKSKDKDHGTPSGKSQHTSPNQPPAGSHLRSEYTTSPKKRKATGGHQAAPTPSSHTSPSFSHQGSSGSASGRRRRANSRVSDTSSHSQPRTARESGRQSFSEAESGRNSAHAETRHPQQHHPAGSDGREMRERRQVSRDLSERNSPKRES